MDTEYFNLNSLSSLSGRVSLRCPGSRTRFSTID